MRKPTAVALVVLAAGAPLASANLLVDPGFELNPIGDYYDVLDHFADYEGTWGAEAGYITGSEGGVTPAEGIRMLGMVDDGLTATQTVQMTHVLGYSALIESGKGVVELDALFNVGANVPAAASSVFVAFFSGSKYGSMIGGYIGQGLHLDADPLTWEQAALSVPIPSETRWILSQVAYSDVSLEGQPGYADEAHMQVVPTPASAGLLALAGTVSLRRRR